MDAASQPSTSLHDVMLGPGDHWARVIEVGQVLRIVDLEGQQAVDSLCWDAHDPVDRYNAADTIKYAGTIYLTCGHGLYSTRGKWLFTIIEDTVGGHDSLAGCCSSANDLFRYGVLDAPNCYDNVVAALRPFGLVPRDIVPNINFFMNVAVGSDGALAVTSGRSRTGDHVELRAEHRALAVISNCPQTPNATNGFRPTPVWLVVYEP